MHRFRLSISAMVFGVTIFVTTGIADAQLVNQFGNLLLSTFKIADPNGIPNIVDNRGTGDVFPNDEIDINGQFGLDVALAVLLGRVEEQPLSGDPAEAAERDRIVEGIQDIAGIVETKFAGSGIINPGLGGVVGVNPSATVAGINEVGIAVASLTNTEVLTSDSVSLAVAVVADADPFVILTGSITNTSETQPLNAFLPFEEAFLNPIALDAPLLRETFISTELRDTDGDGDASLRAAGLEFQILATTDPDNPSLGNTDPIGVSERLGLPRLRNPGVEFFLTDEAAPVDNSLFVSQRAQISHATGQLVLEDLSPGDTVDFTAILSLGIEGDPLTPLIPTESLRSLVLGAELVANVTVPEPSSGLLAALTSATLLMRRRCGRRDA